MFTTTFLLSILATAVYALPSPNPQQLGPALPGAPSDRPEWATIGNISFAGTGCPAGSVSSQMNDGKDIINLSFSNYFAQSFKGALGSDKTKNCNVNMAVRFPPGYSVTVATTDVRGFAILDPSCTGTLSGRFWWSGQQAEASIQNPIPGPFVGDYTKTVSVPTTSMVYSTCGANGPLFNIDTRLLALCNVTDESAFIQVDAQDTALKTPLQVNLGLTWKKC